MFVPGDQPLLSRESIETMMLSYSQMTAPILRLHYGEQAGAPILFDQYYFPELLHLPEGKGGSVLTKKYPEQVHLIPAREAYELYDIDTPEDLLRISDPKDLPKHSNH